MRWASYRRSAEHPPRAAVLQDGQLHGAGSTLLELLHSGTDLLEAGRRVLDDPTEVLPLAEATLLAPIPDPPSVRDFMAFEAHVVTALTAVGMQVDPAWYSLPAFYFSNPAAITDPDAEIPVPPGCHMFDYELEVAAIVGRPGSDLGPRAAEACIAGFTILCDWSARDLQRVESRIGLGPVKAKDTATSLGPVLVTPDELEPFRSGNGYALRMSASVNGRRYSEGSWADLYWSFGEMLSYASRGTRLRPGDVIGSGTVGTGCILELAGVAGPEEFPWLQVGDTVTLEVEQLGALSGRVVPGPPPVALR